MALMLAFHLLVQSASVSHSGHGSDALPDCLSKLSQILPFDTPLASASISLCLFVDFHQPTNFIVNDPKSVLQLVCSFFLLYFLQNLGVVCKKQTSEFNMKKYQQIYQILKSNNLEENIEWGFSA